MPPLFSSGVVGQTTTHLVNRETDLSLGSLLSRNQSVYHHNTQGLNVLIMKLPVLLLCPFLSILISLSPLSLSLTRHLYSLSFSLSISLPLSLFSLKLCSLSMSLSINHSFFVFLSLFISQEFEENVDNYRYRFSLATNIFRRRPCYNPSIE